MSRTQALIRWQGKELVRDLASKSILIRAPVHARGGGRSAGGHKDVDEVAAEQAGLAGRVAFLQQKVCIKG